MREGEGWGGGVRGGERRGREGEVDGEARNNTFVLK